MSSKTFSRVCIVAPARVTCANIFNTIQIAHRLPKTVLEREAGARLRDMASAVRPGSGEGMGIMAGTGTGKTVGLRMLSSHILQTDNLTYGIMTREHDARLARNANVLVVTPGIMRMLIRRGQVDPMRDKIFIDEVHETSSELELVMALLCHHGFSTSWLSGTVDPECYGTFLRSREVVRCSAFDPEREAGLHFHDWDADDGQKGMEEAVAKLAPTLATEGRGTLMFVPSRRNAEELARTAQRYMPAFFYHAGTAVEELQPFLLGQIKPPFIVFMTPAGSSSLNLPGVDAVVMVDSEFREEVIDGERVLVRRKLTHNRLLQQAGRVRGRARNAQVHVLSDRRFAWNDLRPHAPEFMLGADTTHLVLATAQCGVRAEEVEVLGGVDTAACRRTFEHMVARGLVAETPCVALTDFGRRVVDLPVSPERAEMVVRANADAAYVSIIPMVLVCAVAPQVYKLLRGSYFDVAHAVNGSDHLSVYNAIAGLLQHLEHQGGWNGEKVPYRAVGEYAQDYGYDARVLGDALLALRSLCDALGAKLLTGSDTPYVTDIASVEAFLFRKLLAQARSLETFHATCSALDGVAAGSQLSELPREGVVMGDVSNQERYGTVVQQAEGTLIDGRVLMETADTVSILSFLEFAEDGMHVVCRAQIAFGPFSFVASVPFLPRELSTDMQETCRNKLSELIARDIVRLGRCSRLQEFRERYLVAFRVAQRGGTNWARFELEALAMARDVETKIGSACTVAEIADGVLDGYFIPLTSEVVSKVEAENPITIVLAGLDHQVAYGYMVQPRITLDQRIMTQNRWAQLPDTICLPSGRNVEVSVRFASFFTDTDTSEAVVSSNGQYLKQVFDREYRAYRWRTAVKPKLEYDWAHQKFPEVLSVSYGRSPLTEQDYVKYGVLKMAVLYDDVRSGVLWFDSFDAAKLARVQNMYCTNEPLFKTIQDKKGKVLAAQQVLSRAEAVQEYNAAFSPGTRGAVARLITDGIPKKPTDLDGWLARAERVVLQAEREVSAVLEKERRQCEEREQILPMLRVIIEALGRKETPDLLDTLHTVYTLSCKLLLEWALGEKRGQTYETLMQHVDRAVQSTDGAADRRAKLQRVFGADLIPDNCYNWQRGQDIVLMKACLEYQARELGIV